MEKVAEVLAGLREERRRLVVELAGVDRAIAALEEVLGIEPAPEEQAVVTAPEPRAPEVEATPVPSGPYAIPGLYSAVVAYLTDAGEPKTAREIAQALQAGRLPDARGGFHRNSADDVATKVLHRAIRHLRDRNRRSLVRSHLTGERHDQPREPDDDLDGRSDESRGRVDGLPGRDNDLRGRDNGLRGRDNGLRERNNGLRERNVALRERNVALREANIVPPLTQHRARRAQH